MRKILSLCVAAGARIALPGEFTQRAFLNGRIDLTQAEAVNELIKADSDYRQKAAMRQLNGSVERLLRPLCDDILHLLELIAVNVDYPEYEEAELLTMDVILPSLERYIAMLQEIIRQGENNRLLVQGIRTVIAGAPNVGKSSLLNALLQKEKAIVTEIAGTTRDLVEGIVHLDDLTLHVIDTAGIHDTEDRIEQIGIEKSKEALQQADLVIFVTEAGKELTEEERDLLEQIKEKDPLIVYNKTDLHPITEGIGISAATKEITPLIEAIKQRFASRMIVQEDVLSNERQLGLARAALRQIQDAQMAAQSFVEPDLFSIDIQAAYTSLKEILGEVSQDDLLNKIFADFCLGK